MDEKGKRFASEDEAVNESEFSEERDEAPAPAKHNKDKRLKEKNSKKLEKQLKKQQRREKHSHRETLTYEDMPLEEREDDDTVPVRRKNISGKKLTAVAVIVLLLFGIVFYAFNSDKLSFHNISNFFRYGLLNSRSEEQFPLDIKGMSVTPGNFTRVGQDICYTSDTKTQLLNNYGRSDFTTQHAFITPVLTVGEKGALVYNLGGTGYQLIDREGTVFSAEMQDDILTADYGDNGVYAIVTESSGYLSKLYVFSEENEQIFAYSFADYYVTAVSLNSSGSKAVVSGISALNGMEISSLYVLDFTKDTPLYFLELENNIIYDVEYLSDKYACAVGRNASYSLNTYNGEITTNEYEGRDLTAFDINTDTNTYTVSLSSSGDGRNCDIVSFSINGNQDKSFTVDEKIIDLSTYKGRVALLTDESVMLYSKSGNAYSEKALSSDPHSVVLYTTSDVYVLCTGYINALSL
ncbi:MAG: hypothetical protein IJH07_07335 [Ruminococcus sp.]|nr:hypothetical protein [Ruminococcus sp.]